jgi:hypothetical protein
MGRRAIERVKEEVKRGREYKRAGLRGVVVGVPKE